MYVIALEKMLGAVVKKGFYLMLRTNTIVNVTITQERKRFNAFRAY